MAGGTHPGGWCLWNGHLCCSRTWSAQDSGAASAAAADGPEVAAAYGTARDTAPPTSHEEKGPEEEDVQDTTGDTWRGTLGQNQRWRWVVYSEGGRETQGSPTTGRAAAPRLEEHCRRSMAVVLAATGATVPNVPDEHQNAKQENRAGAAPSPRKHTNRGERQGRRPGGGTWGSRRTGKSGSGYRGDRQGTATDAVGRPRHWRRPQDGGNNTPAPSRGARRTSSLASTRSLAAAATARGGAAAASASTPAVTPTATRGWNCTAGNSRTYRAAIDTRSNGVPIVPRACGRRRCHSAAPRCRFDRPRA